MLDRAGGRCRGCRGTGRGRQPFNKELVECYKCNKLWHYQYQCPSVEGSANYAKFDEEEMMLMTSTKATNTTIEGNKWFIYHERFNEFGKLGENSKMSVMW